MLINYINVQTDNTTAELLGDSQLDFPFPLLLLIHDPEGVESFTIIEIFSALYLLIKTESCKERNLWKGKSLIFACVSDL